MKKLNKLEINSEKVIKNEELITLRGGYGGTWYGDCVVYVPGLGNVASGPGAGSSLHDAEQVCNNYYRSFFGPTAVCSCCC